MTTNKITSKAVEADAKYPIDVDSVDGIDAASSATANQLLALDGSSQLPASADMVDGKHWTDMNKGSATFILGNKDRVIESGESSMACFSFACTITEVHVREVGEISGSVAISLGRADGDSDSSWDSIATPSLTSQWYRAITGLTHTITAGDWVKAATTGDGTSTKQVAVTVFFERT